MSEKIRKKILYKTLKLSPIPTTIDFRKQTHEQLLTNHNCFNTLDYQEQPTDEHIKKIKIVIYTPELDISCGGILVLHYLAQTLQNIVENDIIVLLYSSNYKKYKNSFCNNFFNPNLMDDNTIVIYPETIVGNPLNAKYIIRWILLELGIDTKLEQVKTWNPKDLVYHWEPNKNVNSKQLINLWIDPEIKLYNFSKDRKYNCYAYKKLQWCEPGTFHKNINIYHDENIDICIDKHYDNNNTKKIIEIFNNSQKFYCYDPNTFYSVMAPLCGCITVLHPIEGVSKEQFLKSRILYHNGVCFDDGIAYGNSSEEMRHARETINNANEKFKLLIDKHKSTVYSFLSDINDLINNKLIANNTVERIYL